MSEIWDKYISLGGDQLGKPLHEERACPDEIGRYQTYRRDSDGMISSIHYYPKLGCYVTLGAMRSKWERLGYERGIMGYPISDEKQLLWSEILNRYPNAPNLKWEFLPDEVLQAQLFEHGVMIWTTGWNESDAFDSTGTRIFAENNNEPRRIPIAEKVKFWEEQERLNRILIPRVLKNHQLFVQLSKQLVNNSNLVDKVEGRLITQENNSEQYQKILDKFNEKLSAQDSNIKQYKKMFESIEERIKSLESINDGYKEISERLSILELNKKENEFLQIGPIKLKIKLLLIMLLVLSITSIVSHFIK